MQDFHREAQKLYTSNPKNQNISVESETAHWQQYMIILFKDKVNQICRAYFHRLHVIPNIINDVWTEDWVIWKFPKDLQHSTNMDLRRFIFPIWNKNIINNWPSSLIEPYFGIESLKKKVPLAPGWEVLMFCAIRWS